MSNNRYPSREETPYYVTVIAQDPLCIRYLHQGLGSLSFRFIINDIPSLESMPVTKQVQDLLLLELMNCSDEVQALTTYTNLQQHFKDIPIIALLDANTSGLASKMIEYGAFDCIEKPSKKNKKSQFLFALKSSMSRFHIKQKEAIGWHFFESNPIAMITLNKQCQITQANLMARLIFSNTPSSTDHPLLANLKEFATSTSDNMSVFSREVTVKNKIYDQKIFRLHSSDLYSYIIDITDKKNHESMLINLAHCDPLTGLPNRVQLREVLERNLSQLKRRDQSMALLYLDLDMFKKINDNLGHEIGDFLLKKVATRLQESVRKEDLIARIGGDEFVVLLENIGILIKAAIVARKILLSFKQPFLIHHHEIFISCSIGISTCSKADNISVDMFIQHADMAMYKAKQEGRNQYQYYSETLNTKASRYLTLENHLHHAIHKNELFLLFQPIYSAKSKKMVGMEALLRWKNNMLGIIEPEEFIKVAEQSGLITDLGHWIMEKSFFEYNNFKDLQKNRGHSIDLSINFSVVQFTDTTIYDRLLKLMVKYNIQAQDLIVEITESAIMSDIKNAQEILQKLVTLGIKIAIDDFGTGYASFRYLQQLPVQIIKIDKSFINNMNHQLSANAIVKTSIILGHELSLQVIAEGVETEEQFDLLKKLGCDLIQGYYFSKPILISNIIF